MSLIDPPEAVRELAAACRNVGCWPVLVGDEGDKDTILSAPIILYDYPAIAPESPGELFDGTEIDEILTLRIMTLTDDEKAAMAAVDERARAVLTRTESLGKEQMLGVARHVPRAPASFGRSPIMDNWDPTALQPRQESIRVAGTSVPPGRPRTALAAGRRRHPGHGPQGKDRHDRRHRARL